MARKKNPPLAAISLGPYVKLYSEDHFLKELVPLGMNRRALRAFLKALSVPCLHIGSLRLIDAFSLSIALRSVLRVGAPDFLVPGSETIERGTTPSHTTRTISLDFLKRNLETVIAELLAAHRTTAWQIPQDEIKDAAREAARRMLHAGFISLPHTAQAAYTRQAIAALRTDPLTPGSLPNEPATTP